MRDGPVSAPCERLIETAGANTLQLAAVGRQIGWSRRDLLPFVQLRVRGTLSSDRPALLRVVRIEAERHEDRLDVEVEVPSDAEGNLVMLDLFFEGIPYDPQGEPELLTRLELRRSWLRVSGPPPMEMPRPPVLPRHSPLEIFAAQKEVQREASRLAERHAEWNERVLRQLASAKMTAE
jgi:hypothetical protein